MLYRIENTRLYYLKFSKDELIYVYMLSKVHCVAGNPHSNLMRKDEMFQFFSTKKGLKLIYASDN